MNKDDSVARRWYAIVRDAGNIHRWDLKDRLSITVNDYYRLSSYILYKFSNDLEYNKKSQIWSFVGSVKKEAQQIMEARNIE